MAESTKIDDVQKKSGKVVSDSSEVLQDKLAKSYDDIIDRLKDERDWLERELRHEYRNARRYVRTNPEQSIGLALLAGVVTGILIGRSSK